MQLVREDGVGRQHGGMEEAAEKAHWHERAGIAEAAEGEEVSGEERKRHAAIDHLIKPAAKDRAAVTV